MADSNSILSSERKEKEEVIDKALRPTRLKDYAGQDGIREQLDLFITAARLDGRHMVFKPVMQARGNLHGLWVNLLFHNRLALIVGNDFIVYHSLKSCVIY